MPFGISLFCTWGIGILSFLFFLCHFELFLHFGNSLVCLGGHRDFAFSHFSMPFEVVFAIWYQFSDKMSRKYRWIYHRSNGFIGFVGILVINLAGGKGEFITGSMNL